MKSSGENNSATPLAYLVFLIRIAIMSREIYLLVFPQRNTPAHWSIFIPEANSVVKGKVIHVVGSPFTGYKLEDKPTFPENPSRSSEQQPHSGCDRKQRYYGHPEHDILEARAKLVQPPGVSPSPLNPNAERLVRSDEQEIVN